MRRSPEYKKDVTNMRLDIKQLKGLYEGRPIAVLGAGPSLPADLEKIPDESILMSVNYHALLIAECDYMVFMDQKRRMPAEQIQAIETTSAIKVSQYIEQSDVDLSGVDYWNGGMSSTLATWFACYLGGDPALLCGMDLFRGKKPYFHEIDEPPKIAQQRAYPIENHLNAWRPALTQCPHSERIRVVSGPLVEIFPLYK